MGQNLIRTGFVEETEDTGAHIFATGPTGYTLTVPYRDDAGDQHREAAEALIAAMMSRAAAIQRVKGNGTGYYWSVTY